jgi:hypothetical protein
MGGGERSQTPDDCSGIGALVGLVEL